MCPKNLTKKKTRLKPCPVCGNGKPVLWELPEVYWIQCTSCGTTTEMENNKFTALSKWNQLKYKKVKNQG